MWHASYFMCRLVSPPLWSRTSTPSSPLLLSSSTLTSSATSLSSYRRSCLSSFGLFHLYELFLTVTVVSELGGGEWSCETEASESDWTDRQGGSLWGNHRKSMCRSYVYMKLYFCPSTKTELKVGLWTRQAVISYNAEMWQPVIDVELLKLVKACTVIIIILLWNNWMIVEHWLLNNCGKNDCI